MNWTRTVLLALLLSACATTPALPDLPPDHPARSDAPETAPPPRTPTLGAQREESAEQDPAPAHVPSRASDHDARSHR